MTDKEKEDVENSAWIVNTVLKRLGLSGNADLRQDALLYLCECRQRFDESRGVKWCTYAYKSAYLYILRTNKKNCRELVLDTESQSECDYDYTEVAEFMTCCNEREQVFITMKSQGYSLAEIAKCMHLSVNSVQKIRNKLKEKYYEKM